jgi:hypothetical protein
MSGIASVERIVDREGPQQARMFQELVERA